MLYPKMSATRTVSDLSGFWNFKIEKNGEEIDVDKPLSNPITMAVPASFNDQVIDDEIRNHDGYFWYETTFNISALQKTQRNVMRFGSATHEAQVYINGKEVAQHTGGFTPFEFEIDDYIRVGENNLKVRLCNLLSNKTLPGGETTKKANGEYETTGYFDFYNYAGIHRPVKIYTTSLQAHIDEIVVKYDTDLKETTVKPEIEISGNYDNISLEIINQDGKMVENTRSEKLADAEPLVISDTHLWNVGNAYMYQLKVSLWDENNQLIDTYTQDFGVRTVEIKDCKILVNSEPVYLKGFGRHEDFQIIGKGMNRAVINHDHQVLKWIGANAFRSSHYPYSEEEMQMADKDGIMVIDEVPAVGIYSDFQNAMAGGETQINTWKNMKTMPAHKQVIQETITRDQNHPSVIMWSVANEAATQQDGAHEYFKEITDFTREHDWQKLPLIAPKILVSTPDVDKVTDLFDVIGLNRYYGWYVDFNDLNKAKDDLRNEIKEWHKLYPDKPLVFTEFGADTMSGMNSMYREPYSEGYQVDYYKANFEVFDEFDYVMGELLWNFADFATPAGLIRVNGNRKGVFTRDREPKAIAYVLQKRWNQIEEEK